MSNPLFQCCVCGCKGISRKTEILPKNGNLTPETNPLEFPSYNLYLLFRVLNAAIRFFALPEFTIFIILRVS